jgi:hypothetical protein
MAAIVHLGDDAVCFVLAVKADCSPRPFGRRISARLIRKHVTVTVGVLAGHDDAGLVGVLAGRHGGIDRHDDPHQVRDISMDWPARLLDQRAGPKGTWYVVQYLGVELLPAEPGALVLAYDLLQKRRRKVGPIERGVMK